MFGSAKKQTLSFNYPNYTMDLPRHVAGKATFAQLLDSWIEISGINSFDWSLLATEALGANKLHQSQISALRRGVTTHLGVMVLDAIAAVNAAAWKYHRENKSILKGIHAHKISQIPPLECNCQAANAADFLLIYLGLQDAPPLPENWLGVKKEESIEPQSDSKLSKMAGRSIRLPKAARLLGIPIDVAKQRQIPRIYEQLQQLLADPPAWLPEAQAQRRAHSAAKRERELAVYAKREAVVAGAQKAIVKAIQSSPALDTCSEEFAFHVLDGAMVSLYHRYDESTLEAAAWALYPEAAYILMGD